MVYQIKIKGVLDQSWRNWLGNVEIGSEPHHPAGQVTLLTVNPVDQAALFGILDTIRDLNLALISVVLLEDCS
jgi:hypothetical protein